MNCKILINAIDPEECRIAKVKDGKLEEFHIESAAREIIHSNIYKGIIARIEPSLQAVFVDYGTERHGFLQKHEIHSDYFQNSHPGDRSITNIVKRGSFANLKLTPLKGKLQPKIDPLEANLWYRNGCYQFKNRREKGECLKRNLRDVRSERS